MAAMLPTEEIAATMYVSVNTVKTHVRSILRKLSRVAAQRGGPPGPLPRHSRGAESAVAVTRAG